jgi:hypothetical protein
MKTRFQLTYATGRVLPIRIANTRLSESDESVRVLNLFTYEQFIQLEHLYVFERYLKTEIEEITV